MQLTCNIAFWKPVNFNVLRYQSVNRNYQRDNYGGTSKRWKTCNYKILQFVELAEKYRIGTRLKLNCNVIAANRKKKFFKDVIHKDSIFFCSTCPCDSYAIEYERSGMSAVTCIPERGICRSTLMRGDQR